MKELLSCSLWHSTQSKGPRATTLLYAGLTSRAGGSIAAQLTHLTGCSMEALLAATFPTAQKPVLALPMA